MSDKKEIIPSEYLPNIDKYMEKAKLIEALYGKALYCVTNGICPKCGGDNILYDNEHENHIDFKYECLKCGTEVYKNIVRIK